MKRRGPAPRPPVLALHGGAGAIRRGEMTAARAARLRAALREALEAGWRVLRADGPALDAVVAAVAVMEDAGVFNAGRGAVPAADGSHELDASVMDGATHRAGAVAAVRRLRNPVLAARAVMERTPHVMLAGAGAEQFAAQAGVPSVPESYFVSPPSARSPGTVGAVALDAAGHLAAATSTGGIQGKLPGRVGDSPIVGAGTWADDATCAVSGTGHGESFVRATLAREVSARMAYLGEPLARAAQAALGRVAALGGSGGLVAVDRRGRVAMPFTTAGMYRAWIGRGARPAVALFR